MERLGGEHEGQTRSIAQVAGASLIGSALEWYDFFIYGTMAALVFNELFFPQVSPLIGTLAAFVTFGVGFVARPIGGLVFGHFGDKIGRKSMLVITLMIMGIATVLIGLLPTYETIGIWAPALLVVLRLAQGFGVGGEWGGAVLMAIEHAPEGRRGFYGSWPQMGVPAGLLIAELVYLVVHTSLPEAAFLSWGWRIPFLISIVLVVVGLVIRLRIAESPAFEQMEERGAEAGAPILEVIRTYPKNILLAMGARLGDNVLFYIFTVFVLTYVAERLGLPEGVALTGVLIGAAIEFFAIPFYGALTDRVGRRPVYMGGAAFSLLFAFPYFWMLNSESSVLIVLAIVMSLVFGHAAMYAPQASFLSELFGTNVRYTGASIGYQLAPILGGGIAPFVATALLARTDSYVPIVVYMIAMASVTVISVFLAAETSFGDISSAERQPEERRIATE